MNKIKTLNLCIAGLGTVGSSVINSLTKNHQLIFQKINTDFNQAFVITTHNPEVASIGKKKYYLGNGSLSPTDKF